MNKKQLNFSLFKHSTPKPHKKPSAAINAMFERDDKKRIKVKGYITVVLNIANVTCFASKINRPNNTKYVKI